jgi:hypothetical protein
LPFVSDVVFFFIFLFLIFFSYCSTEWSGNLRMSH